MTKILQFPDTLGGVAPTEVLKNAQSTDFEIVAVIGYTADGDLYVDVSRAEIRDLACLHRQFGLVVDQQIVGADG